MDRIPDRESILLTGATGFLGGELLARLLAKGERPVIAFVRAGSVDEAQARLRATIARLLGDPEPWARNAYAVPADISRPDLGLSAKLFRRVAESTRLIIHCAATVSFASGLEECRAVNVDGTRRLLDLAELCSRQGDFDCFTYISTAYVAGTHAARFGEDDLDVGQEFRNAYERSKFEAELVVSRRSHALPVRVLRPSIVVGDSRTGWTPVYNVIYWPLRAFAEGAYTAIPARRSAPVDVVPVDYVADAVLALADRPGMPCHLAAGERASSVGELLRLAGSYLKRPTPAVVSPGLYHAAVHPLLLLRRRGVQRLALKRSEAFFPYFSMRVHYDNARARKELSAFGLEVPPLRSYFHRLMDFALATQWGRRPLARECLRAPLQERAPETG